MKFHFALLSETILAEFIFILIAVFLAGAVACSGAFFRIVGSNDAGGRSSVASQLASNLVDKEHLQTTFFPKAHSIPFLEIVNDSRREFRMPPYNLSDPAFRKGIHKKLNVEEAPFEPLYGDLWAMA